MYEIENMSTEEVAALAAKAARRAAKKAIKRAKLAEEVDTFLAECCRPVVFKHDVIRAFPNANQKLLKKILNEYWWLRSF